MITLEKIKKSVVSILNTQNLKVYGTEIEEGFKRPCFFVQIMPLSSELVNRNFSENLFTIEIDYFSADKSDIENVKMYDILRSSFNNPLMVGDRKFLCKKIRMEALEENVMSFKFDLNFYDVARDIVSDAPEASELNLNIKGGI